MITPKDSLPVIHAREWIAIEPLILDTETTGLGEDARIVEISILDSIGATVFSSLINPEIPIPPEATAIHGISDEAVGSAPTWPDIFSTINAILSYKLILSYNAAYDRRMIDQMNRTYKSTFHSEPHWGCIMEAFADFYGEWDEYHKNNRWQKLEIAADLLDIPVDRNTIHRASYDANIARQVVLAMANTALEDDVSMEGLMQTTWETDIRLLGTLQERLEAQRVTMRAKEAELAADPVYSHAIEEFKKLHAQVVEISEAIISDAEDAYEIDKNKHPHPAITVKIMKRVVFPNGDDRDRIKRDNLWAYARKTDGAIIPESLNKSVLEKLARAVADISPVPGLVIIEEPKASIARDLTPWLSTK